MTRLVHGSHVYEVPTEILDNAAQSVYASRCSREGDTADGIYSIGDHLYAVAALIGSGLLEQYRTEETL